jgi:hypothetical protein
VLLTHRHVIWSEQWQPIETRLAEIETVLLRKRAAVKRGGDFDRWDMEIRGGLLGSVRTVAMIEEHGAGKQLFRLRAWPRIPRPASGLLLLLSLLATLAAYDQAWLVALALAVGALGIALIVRAECANAMQTWRNAVDEYAGLKWGFAESSRIDGIALGSSQLT